MSDLADATKIIVDRVHANICTIADIEFFMREMLELDVNLIESVGAVRIEFSPNTPIPILFRAKWLLRERAPLTIRFILACKRPGCATGFTLTL